MTQSTDLYATLGLDKAIATAADIKQAYRRLAVKLHPDKQSPERKSVAEQEFAALNAAYNVLSDPERRSVYDMTGVADQEDLPSADPFFPAMFSTLFARSFKAQPMHAVYMQDLHVSLVDVIKGNPCKKISVKLEATCKRCNGTGAASPDDVITCMNCHGNGIKTHVIDHGMMASVCTACHGKGTYIRSHRQCTKCHGTTRAQEQKEYVVQVPRGVQNGHKIVVNTANDCKVVARVVYDLDAKKCWVQGTDVHFRLPSITLKELLCGFVRKIDMYGKNVTFKSSGYFNPSKPKKLEGRGLPHGDKCGDAYIHYDVVYEDYVALVKRSAELAQFFP